MRKKISQITDNERVIFYVAGYKPGYIEKAMTLGLKNIILCLEDGTPENKKIEARSLVKRALSEFKDLDLNLIVRINSVYTDHWKADFEALLENRPTRIRIPMVNKAEDLLEIDEYWRFISKESDDDYKPLYEIMIESKEGLNNLERIYQCSDNIYAFTLGGGDYYDDVKLNSDDPQKEVLFAKQKICQFCNENSLYSFDTTFMKYKDLEGYRNDCEFSRNLGFTGRSIIHPDQIKIGLEVYSERKGTYV
ncbi:aldolase/citrate lyase family protein [Paenibacillus woosongensis]|uniref:Aldolase/citrate lyase family protein n=1 Tax=Paenibacillus woosongensis TaxID=307580 RepID=A0AA95KVJ3_9BACL|nr:aldolase/citrate lyase family protein [Paenibacillus woosongensis]WHX48535.1 aldolase/citrate lyase family protein [Paenibacillus woosongensis]